MESLKNCPISDSPKLEKHAEIRDHFLSKEVFSLEKCSESKLLITNPRPDENSIVKYYKSDSYISHSNESRSITSSIYKLVRNYTIGQKLKMIERFSFKGQLLDYGCGTGHFLEKAQQKGWEVQGVEPDSTARENQASSLQGKVAESLSGIQEGAQFNVITLFHVLEHVHRLDETMQTLIGMLQRNGVLFLALPNHESHDAQHYGGYWAGYDVPRHLYHFNQRAVFQLSKKYGLNIVSTIPMKFDSYYVSMLSEKYMGNSMSFVKGLINGYKSNRRAKRTKEYSSLIYVLTK